VYRHAIVRLPSWRFRPSRRRRACTALAVAVAASALVAIGGVSPASACSAYWTVGCQYYSYQEGHSVTNQGGDSWEVVYTTFDPTNTAIKAIHTTAGGSWVESQALLYGGSTVFFSESASDKNGCFNNNTYQVFVNCRAANNT
jgi:hypothetical protein